MGADGGDALTARRRRPGRSDDFVPIEGLPDRRRRDADGERRPGPALRRAGSDLQ